MVATTTVPLIIQVQKAKQEFITDGYAMSIGELVSMYKEGDLNIDPDFQRKFRWSALQRTKLIESILIGVPLPSIFVYQTEKGTWEVVDGVQRISTILEFMGELRDNNDEKMPAPALLQTKLLPGLEGTTWQSMPKEPLQLEFRRSKIKVEIIKSTSNKNAKFEVFQRLNYASVLSGQEFRNALLVMLNKPLYEWLKTLAESKDFLVCLDLTDKWLEEDYHYELVLRLFVFTLYVAKPIYKVDDFINEYFIYSETDSILQKIQDNDFSLTEEKDKFFKTFKLLYEAGDAAQVFKKEGRGTQFLESYFEAIAVGLYSNIDSYSEDDINLIRDKISIIKKNLPSSKNTSARIPVTVKFGKDLFNK
jgi:hypothetical protein